jgi:hypothetical protein
VNPPLLEPGTCTVDKAEYGHDRVVGSIVLSPGDVRGTEFVHERVDIGCWSLVSWRPSMACIVCGALVAGRTDDCCVRFSDTRAAGRIRPRMRESSGHRGDARGFRSVRRQGLEPRTR